ncbi:MAG: ATP-binding cassette domain-containing protein [Pseudomonadales bacterium]|jgi:NitT/TauT family transport system ATP-binding protein|nr:ATP-binding cassette domain-containing protein [Pseudomonadales bacterium]MBL6808353.1 ATP-binding cassette domain-containing protein [Pseudomonadales bacterium]MDA0955192.1 ATP-binding cassette domain-containing protein [Pseudomonadota bacterium]
MSELVLKNVGKRYGETVVLERLNLTLTAGDFCAVVGASGAGKSTFLKLLLSELQPSEGTITLGGRPLPPEPGPERGVVYQRYSVFPHLSVLDNVRFGLERTHGDPLFGRTWGARRRALRAEAEALVDAVGLSAARDRFPGALSGGMQQRLALAQTLALKPELLLLDEPFGALDPGNKKAAHDLLKTLWRDRGMTVVMVTHDLSEAFTLAKRVLVLDKTREDPHNPERYGASLTYDIPVDNGLPPREAAPRELSA